MKLEQGVRIQDYVLVERLGAGAFGEVWKAVHSHLPRTVAIKFATSDAAAVALLREGVAQFGLDHPGITKVLDANLSAAPPYVILEYVEGRSLREVLRERGRLEIPDVASIFGQLAAAIAYAHERGVLHGDVKPENVLVTHGVGPQVKVKITDFQLGGAAAGARPVEPGEGGVRPSLATRGPLGTYRYLAPEQEFDEGVDGRADLFALGVVLFEMLTGKLPQGRDLPSDVEPSVSWWWDHIFARCYTGRERRYRDAAELLTDLGSAASGPRWGDMPSQKAQRAEREADAAADAQRFAAQAIELRRAARRARPGEASRARGGLTAAGIAVALLALIIPIGVLSSIDAFERMPFAVASSDGMHVYQGADLEDWLLRQYRPVIRELDRAGPTPRIMERMDEIQRTARRGGYSLWHGWRGDDLVIVLETFDGKRSRTVLVYQSY